MTVSPDGQTIVFQGIHQVSDAGKTWWEAGSAALFRRALSGVGAELIRGTEGGFSPFFSPDGQWIGFFTRRELKKVPLSGGTAVTLSWVPPVTAGGSWGEDGRIVMTRTFNGALVAIPESGGEFRFLTRLDASRGERAHLFPQVLPGGRGILFTLRRGRDFTDAEASDIAVLDPSTGKWKTVLEGASFARYGAGRLVFVRGGSVFWVPFDVSRLSVTGPAVALPENITVDGEERFGHFDVSSAGTLVFLDGPPSPPTTSTVLTLDRNGKESALPLPPGYYMLARFSPDGGRIALTRFAGIRGTIVMYERERHIVSTLTPEPGTHFVAVWSPDGRRIAFSRFAEAQPRLERQERRRERRDRASDRTERGRPVPQLLVSGRQDHPVYAWHTPPTAARSGSSPRRTSGSSRPETGAPPASGSRVLFARRAARSRPTAVGSPTFRTSRESGKSMSGPIRAPAPASRSPTASPSSRSGRGTAGSSTTAPERARRSSWPPRSEPSPGLVDLPAPAPLLFRARRRRPRRPIPRVRRLRRREGVRVGALQPARGAGPAAHDRDELGRDGLWRGKGGVTAAAFVLDRVLDASRR